MKRSVFQRTEKMSAKEEKRIFIGGLVKGVTDLELKEKFSRFGQVGQIEIKTRDNELGMILVNGSLKYCHLYCLATLFLLNFCVTSADCSCMLLILFTVTQIVK